MRARLRVEGVYSDAEEQRPRMRGSGISSREGRFSREWMGRLAL